MMSSDDNIRVKLRTYVEFESSRRRRLGAPTVAAAAAAIMAPCILHMFTSVTELATCCHPRRAVRVQPHREACPPEVLIGATGRKGASWERLVGPNAAGPPNHACCGARASGDCSASAQAYCDYYCARSRCGPLCVHHVLAFECA